MATRASIDPSFPRLIIFGAPLILGLLELGHPALLPGDDIVATITLIATWWTTLHALATSAGGRTREVHRQLDRGNGTEEHADAPL